MQNRKTTIYFLFFLLTATFVVTGCKKSNSTPKVIGEVYQGGKVFYVDATGLHGLVASTSDVSEGSAWGCLDVALSGAAGTAQGTGNQNTLDIVKACSEAGTAARLCNDLTQGGYSDWYLPSKDELNLMYLQKTTIGGFADDMYWSSSQVNKNSAWLQDFKFGTQFSTTPKDYGTHVRAIRAF